MEPISVVSLFSAPAQVQQRRRNTWATTTSWSNGIPPPDASLHRHWWFQEMSGLLSRWFQTEEEEENSLMFFLSSLPNRDFQTLQQSEAWCNFPLNPDIHSEERGDLRTTFREQKINRRRDQHDGCIRRQLTGLHAADVKQSHLLSSLNVLPDSSSQPVCSSYFSHLLRLVWLTGLLCFSLLGCTLLFLFGLVFLKPYSPL